MSESYEAQRLQNIRDNEALLLSLGLATPAKLISGASQRKPKLTAIRERCREDGPFSPVYKLSSPKTGSRNRLAEDGSFSPGVRRSSRQSAWKCDHIDNADLTSKSSPKRKRVEVASLQESEREEEDVVETDQTRLRNAKKMGVRTQNPKTFGRILGVEVGRQWATRMDASTDAVHAPTVAGISGNSVDGAYSVALSGGYPDDIDLGVAFTYTGCGGRDLKGTKQKPKNLRTAPQTTNQTFDWPMNAALRRSAETRLPIRVIRGYKLQSPYAPSEGYRYDGLYIVEKAWMAKGLTKGLMVCKYAFKRVPGQADLIKRIAPDGAVLQMPKHEQVVDGHE